MIVAYKEVYGMLKIRMGEKDGLGNQLFKYALYYFLENESKVALDLGPLFEHDVLKNQQVLVDTLFNFNVRKIFVCKEITINNYIFRIISLINSRLVRYLDWQIITSNNRVYEYYKASKNKKLFQHSNSIVGYWMRENYLIDNREGFIKDFKITPSFEKFVELQYHDYLSLVRSNDSLTIHVRGGDFKPNLTVADNYYAISLKHSPIANAKVHVIITDDVKYSMKLARSLGLKDVKILSNSQSVDFFLLAQARNLIIANSTFSWWGAYLNTNASVIISPKRWTRSGANKDEKKYKPIIPNHWIEVDF
jgi:hypothetical protein